MFIKTMIIYYNSFQTAQPTFKIISIVYQIVYLYHISSDLIHLVCIYRWFNGATKGYQVLLRISSGARIIYMGFILCKLAIELLQGLLEISICELNCSSTKWLHTYSFMSNYIGNVKLFSSMFRNPRQYYTIH